MVVELVCKDYIIIIGDIEIKVDLLVLEMIDFNLILGMDWLVAYYVTFNCFEKTLKFQTLGQIEFTFVGDKLPSQLKMI